MVKNRFPKSFVSLFHFSFIIQELKIDFLFFVRLDLLYFNLKNNREKMQSQSHHSAKLKNKNKCAFLYLKRERENTYIMYKQLNFRFNFWRIRFIRIYRNGKLEISFNSKFNPSFEHLFFCFNLDKTFF